MKNDLKQFYFDILRKEVIPALGCTEPIAVALAAAYAGEQLNHQVDKVEIFVSANVLKNAMGVGIPGTGMIGLPIAAALGALAGSSSAKLEVLEGISPAQLEKAKLFVEQNRVIVRNENTIEKLYIKVICTNGQDTAEAVISGHHDRLTKLSKNDQILQEITASSEIAMEENKSSAYELSVKGIYDFAMEIDFEDIRFILEGAEMNRKMAVEGLKGDYGLRVGKTIKKSVEENKNILGESIANYAMYFTAAASDARMDGLAMPVMSNSGSGNQGLTVMLPVLAVAEKLNVGEEKLARGLILANLLAIHMKYQLGRLAALCGVVIAASGAGAAITYFMGGNFEQIAFSIKNLIGNIAGMICDGAKPGCAMKVATSVNAAVQSAILAINNIEISKHEGIIEEDIEKTIRNLTRIGSVGMEETDKMILDIMVCK